MSAFNIPGPSGEDLGRILVGQALGLEADTRLDDIISSGRDVEKSAKLGFSRTVQHQDFAGFDGGKLHFVATNSLEKYREIVSAGGSKSKSKKAQAELDRFQSGRRETAPNFQRAFAQAIKLAPSIDDSGAAASSSSATSEGFVQALAREISKYVTDQGKLGINDDIAEQRAKDALFAYGKTLGRLATDAAMSTDLGITHDFLQKFRLESSQTVEKIHDKLAAKLEGGNLDVLSQDIDRWMAKDRVSIKDAAGENIPLTVDVPEGDGTVVTTRYPAEGSEAIFSSFMVDTLMPSLLRNVEGFVASDDAGAASSSSAAVAPEFNKAGQGILARATELLKPNGKSLNPGGDEGKQAVARLVTELASDENPNVRAVGFLLAAGFSQELGVDAAGDFAGLAGIADTGEPSRVLNEVKDLTQINIQPGTNEVSFVLTQVPRSAQQGGDISMNDESEAISLNTEITATARFVPGASQAEDRIEISVKAGIISDSASDAKATRLADVATFAGYDVTTATPAPRFQAQLAFTRNLLRDLLNTDEGEAVINTNGFTRESPSGFSRDFLTSVVNKGLLSNLEQVERLAGPAPDGVARTLNQVHTVAVSLKTVLGEMNPRLFEGINMDLLKDKPSGDADAEDLANWKAQVRTNVRETVQSRVLNGHRKQIQDQYLEQEGAGELDAKTRESINREIQEQMDVIDGIIELCRRVDESQTNPQLLVGLSVVFAPQTLPVDLSDPYAALSAKDDFALLYEALLPE